MLNDILELEGIKKLSKNEQKAVNGGRTTCSAPRFSHIDEGANGGAGGAVFTQECTRRFLGIVTGRFTNTFVQ